MSKPDALSDVSLEMISSIMGWSILRWSSACRHDMESVKIKNIFLLERSMHSRAKSTARASVVKMELHNVILNAMTLAMINENRCHRDPLGVFRTVSVEWNVSWESISYGEILIVVCDGWRVRLPRCGELEDDVSSLKLPRRSVRHVVEGHVVQFDPQALKMGSDPEAEGPNGRGL